MSMNTLYDQFQRCLRHPHQRIVGVCSSCLQERLTSLIQPPSPPADQARRAYNVHPHSRTHVAHEPQELNLHANSHAALPNLPGKARVGITDILQDARTQQHSSICIPSDSASTSTAPQNHPITRGSHMTQQTKHHGHHPSSDFVRGAGQKAYQNGRIDKQEYRRASSANPSLERKQRAAHEQNLQSENPFREGEKSKKGGGSWFSLTKSKSSSSSSHGAYSQVDDRGVLKHPSKSPRRNAAPMAGRSIDAHRHAAQGYGRPDLEAIAETNTCDPKHISAPDAGMSSSWISLLFHRKKWSRSRSNLSNSSSGSVQNAISDTSGNDVNFSEPNHRGSSSVEAGRLSWDGTRPNLKQLILKRVEARSKPQVLRDSSPSTQHVDYAMKEYNDNGSREVSNHATHLQKSKSVASARSSISVEMPKDLMQSSFSPTLHQGQSNVMVGFEYDTYYDDRNLRRSRSWGRTWNRALSPLWGSRSHRHKVTIDASASAHQRMQTPVTPSHVDLKSAPTPASTSAHLSPLRRSKLAPTLANLL